MKSRIHLAKSILLLTLAVACKLAPNCAAQWVEQTITLRPGWNSVFLEVDPSPRECETTFAGLPIESVWDWNGNATSVQFVQDPTTLVPGGPDWLTWFDPTHPLRTQGNLHTLRHGRPYLIKVAENAPVTTLKITGKPTIRSIDWRPGGLNLVGFPVGTNSAPTFSTLFAGEAGLVGQPVYRLGSLGAWERITDLTTARPNSGEAYWVRCNGPATRTATVEVAAGSRDGLQFDRGVVEQSIRIRNTSTAGRNISLRLLASANPPAGETPLAGAAPIEYRDANFNALQFDWKPLTGTLTFNNLAPGAEWNLRLAARLSQLPSSAAGSEFQSILEITDDAGSRRLVSVSVSPEDRSNTGNAATTVTSPFAGLWIGEAVIDKVSQPAHASDPQTARSSGGKFQFRLIVHVDGAGIPRLLQESYLVRKPAILKADPDRPGYQLVDQPARSVVLTDESLIPQIIGNSDVIGRRASSAAFGFKGPLNLSGTFGADLSATVALGYDDAQNPYKHLFHPDHNNLDERYEQKLSEGRESFSVTRSIALHFSATDPLGLNPPGWGDSEVGGGYQETISGLHRSQINVSGTFRLVRVSPVPTLNQ